MIWVIGVMFFVLMLFNIRMHLDIRDKTTWKNLLTIPILFPTMVIAIMIPCSCKEPAWIEKLIYGDY